MSNEIKMVCRSIHYICIVLYTIVCSYMVSDRFVDTWYYMTIRYVSCVAMISAGLVNWYLLKDWRREQSIGPYKIWTSITHIKVVIVVVVFIPWIESIVNIGTLSYIRLSIIIVLCLVSTYNRYIRESQTIPARLVSQ